MPVEMVVVTDSLPLPDGHVSQKVVQVSVAGLVAAIIQAEMRNSQDALGFIADSNVGSSEDDFEEE